MKSILVHIHDDHGLETRLQAALDLTRGFGGHLTCLSNVSMVSYAAFSPFGGPYVVTGLFEALQEQETKVRDRVEKHLAKEDVPWSFVSTTNYDDVELVGRGALNDLIVMSHANTMGDSSSTISMIGQVLTSSHTPLMLVPDKHAGFDVHAPAMIAWNGSFEAANALRAAIPLLKKSKSVVVVTINDERHATYPATEASEYLSRHGIKSDLLQQPANGDSIEHLLRQTAHRLNAGYVVLGAFGHSRAREYWFGGVTRTMLLNSKLPLFLAR